MKIYHVETEEANFDELKEFAKTNRARKLAHNTYLLDYDEEIAIQYHGTEVVTFYAGGSIRLKSGGWETSTTKARINAFTPSSISVWQQNRKWYVTTPAGTFDFEDGILIGPIAEWGEGGYVDAPEADPKADARERRRELREEKKRDEARAAQQRWNRINRPTIGPRNFGIA